MGIDELADEWREYAPRRRRQVAHHDNDAPSKRDFHDLKGEFKRKRDWMRVLAMVGAFSIGVRLGGCGSSPKIVYRDPPQTQTVEETGLPTLQLIVSEGKVGVYEVSSGDKGLYLDPSRLPTKEKYYLYKLQEYAQEHRQE